MSQLAESLKRLYKTGQVTAEYINARTSLSVEEKTYILSEEPIIMDNYENAYKVLVGEMA